MKKTTLALAGLMAVSAAANASMSRWNGFGLSNAFIADVQDIWTLPGVVASNADATYLEFNTNASATDDWGGAHVALGPGVLAVWGNRPYTENANINFGAIAGNAFGAPNSGAASGVFLTPAQQIDLIYGFKLSDTVELGLGVNRAVNGLKTETTTAAGTAVTEQSTSDLGVSLGAELKEVGPIALLEIGLQYNMGAGLNSAKNAAGTVNDKVSMTGTDMDVRVGADIKGDGGSAQRIELGFNTDALNFKDEPTTALPASSYAESKNNASYWQLGWAMSKSGDAGMGLGGLILSNLGQTRVNEFRLGAATVDKAETSNMALTFVAAGEAKANSWLTGRAGFSSNLYQATSASSEVGATGATTKTTVTTLGTAAGAATAGLSFTLGNLVLDTVFTQGLVAGAGLGAFLGQVSATYSWGGKE
jgi:hypothetical protein